MASSGTPWMVERTSISKGRLSSAKRSVQNGLISGSTNWTDAAVGKVCLSSSSDQDWLFSVCIATLMKFDERTWIRNCAWQWKLSPPFLQASQALFSGTFRLSIVRAFLLTLKKETWAFTGTYHGVTSAEPKCFMWLSYWKLHVTYICCLTSYAVSAWLGTLCRMLYSWFHSKFFFFNVGNEGWCTQASHYQYQLAVYQNASSFMTDDHNRAVLGVFPQLNTPGGYSTQVHNWKDLDSGRSLHCIAQV